MKNLILTISQKHPKLSSFDFAVIYQREHPHGSTLNSENCRQAFQVYQASCRKIDRAEKGIKRDPNVPR